MVDQKTSKSAKIFPLGYTVYSLIVSKDNSFDVHTLKLFIEFSAQTNTRYSESI